MYKKKTNTLLHGTMLSVFIFNGILSNFDDNPLFGIVGCGITESISEILNTIRGIAAGIQAISNAITFISSFLSLSIVFILLILFAISSGLSSIGIAKGKLNFFLSLFLTDFFWFLWSYGYYLGNFSFLFPMLKINLIILSPLISIYLLKKYAPIIYYRMLRFLYKHDGPTLNELKYINDRLILESAELQRHLNADIFNSGKKANLSFNTISKVKEMRKILNEIHPENITHGGNKCLH